MWPTDTTSPSSTTSTSSPSSATTRARCLTVEVTRNDDRHRHRHRPGPGRCGGRVRARGQPRHRLAAPPPATAGRAATPEHPPGDHITVTSTTSSRRGDRRPDQVQCGRPDARWPTATSSFRSSPSAPTARRTIPAGFIDSPEFRAAANNQVRFEAGPRVFVEQRPGALPGQLRVRYKSPFRPARNDGLRGTRRQLRRALLGDGHAVGFGHVAVLPAEGMLVDGLTDTPGPALGC